MKNKHIFIPVLVVLILAGSWQFVSLKKAGNKAALENQLELEEELTLVEPVKDAIDSSGQNLLQVSNALFENTAIEVLDLSDNDLSGSLPAEIRHLSRLRILDLSNNNFTGVPAEVGQLSKLEVLDLSGNPITGLPHELGNLQNLKTLNLKNTDYSTYDLEIIQAKLPSGVVIEI